MGSPRFPDSATLSRLRSEIRSGRYESRELTDFVLMRDVYRCTPPQFDEIPEATIELHKAILSMESKERELDSKRAALKARAK